MKVLLQLFKSCSLPESVSQKDHGLKPSSFMLNGPLYKLTYNTANLLFI